MINVLFIFSCFLLTCFQSGGKRLLLFISSLLDNWKRCETQIRSRTFCVLSILFVFHAACLCRRIYEPNEQNMKKKKAFVVVNAVDIIKIAKQQCDCVRSFFFFCTMYLRTMIQTITRSSINFSQTFALCLHHTAHILTQIRPEISSSNGCCFICWNHR